VSLAPPLGYALTRIHARHADRPSDSDWRRIRAARSASETLMLARSCALHRWLRNIAETDSSDTVDLKLRANYRRYIFDIYGWMPPPWQPATAWLCRLADLASIAYLERSETPLPWMFKDPGLAPWLDGHDDLARDSGLPDPTALRGGRGGDPAMRWQLYWSTISPSTGCKVQLKRVGHWLVQLTTGPSDRARAALNAMFRGRPLQVTAVFAHVGLVSDDLRRLSGMLARRRPLAEAPAEAT